MRKILVPVVASVAALLVGFGVGTVRATPEPADSVCASAALMAYDAYKTGQADVELDATLDRCADVTGGF